MNELVILSGKGGCGKTTICAGFATLAEDAVFADCDVDAADLFLVLDPTERSREPFYSGFEARIDEQRCVSCGVCRDLCRFDAVVEEDGRFRVDPLACEGCGVCADHCPNEAVVLEDRHCGEMMISDTPYGTLVHAKLGIAAENSGKLVTAVRNRAKAVATEQGRSTVVIDGSPGIGCPVIASLTGATAALVVSEPTVSGLHDLERVLKLGVHFGVPTYACIAKSDINEAMSDTLCELAEKYGAQVLGKIAYDPAVIQAQLAGRPVTETDCRAANEIRMIWDKLSTELKSRAAPGGLPVV